MKIQTKYFGEIGINENEIIRFENGLPGFLDERAFILLPLSENSLFHVLQSTITPHLAFIVTTPFAFKKDYEVNIPDHVGDQLEIDSEEDVQIVVLLTLKEPFHKSTANLMAPIILNRKNNSGKQIVLDAKQNEIRYPLLEKQPARRRTTKCSS